jgi:hypothetical protein
MYVYNAHDVSEVCPTAVSRNTLSFLAFAKLCFQVIRAPDFFLFHLFWLSSVAKQQPCWILSICEKLTSLDKK